MKRIYMTMAFLSALFFGANAQNVELEGYLSMYPGAKLYETANLTGTVADTLGDADSVYGIWGVYVNPTEGILSGDKFALVTSFSSFVQPSEPEFVDTVKYFWVSNYTASADVEPDNFVVGPFSYDSVSTIGLLMDWEQWSENDSVVYLGPPYQDFEPNKEYGFFVRVYDVEGGVDPDPNNNRTVVRIVWNPTLGIGDMIAPVKRSELNVYPNPSNADLNFTFNFDKNSHAKAIVRDITGRIVMSENYGRINVGERAFKLDISSLVSGVYSVELQGDYTSAVAKFTKK